jgi:hypothetical protein
MTTLQDAFRKSEGDDVAPYLRMLHLHTADGERAAAFIRDALVGSGAGAEDELLRMLEGANWRPQLVAAVAVIAGALTPKIEAAMWKVLDVGSWVSPQLVVALSMRAPSFLPEALRRLEKPVDGKVAGALLAMAMRLAPTDPTVIARSGDAELRALISRSLDDGAAFATAWLQQVRRLGLVEA